MDSIKEKDQNPSSSSRICRRCRDKKPEKSRPDAIQEQLTMPSMPFIPAEPTLADFLAGAIHQDFMATVYRHDLRADGRSFCSDVLNWWLSMPGLLADEHGQVLISRTSPVTMEQLSLCVFETAHTLDRDIMSWNSIRTILFLLMRLGNGKKEAKKRACLLQELANICHQHYVDLQAVFRRHVQAGVARKYHKRLADRYDEFGTPLVVLTNHPGDFSRSNPLMYCVLRLCQPDTSPVDSMECTSQIRHIFNISPEKIPFVGSGESAALFDLAIFCGFVRDLQHYIRLPPVSTTECREFIDKTVATCESLNKIKAEFKTFDYVETIFQRAKIPSQDFSVELAADRRVVEALDEFVRAKMGFSMSKLYEKAAVHCYGEAAVVKLSDIDVGIVLNFPAADSPSPAMSPTVASDVAGQLTDRAGKKRRKRKKKSKGAATPAAATAETDKDQKDETEKEADEITDQFGPVISNEISDLPSHLYSDAEASDDSTILATDDDNGDDDDDDDDEENEVQIQHHREPDSSPEGFSSGVEKDEIQAAKVDETIVEEEEAHDNNEPIPEAEDDEPTADPPAEPPAPPKQVIKVSAKTARVFAVLFDKSLQRGSISWTSFIAAFAEIGFAVEKKRGSAIAFIPPAGSPWHQIQFHEAHGGVTRVEGFRSRKMACRLTRNYGWDETTFEIA
ncbi:hypothetical protein CDEST_01600 [Colletotrichum destructivum]|uniref:Ipa protein n=1 Tax=Colletotrichum destructivum TaxID=34406 RepID=A0AAX4I0I4_9PEZI|nr:hypothetical protein CDEST_01600 [Colletotrichum destructivum]